MGSQPVPTFPSLELNLQPTTSKRGGQRGVKRADPKQDAEDQPESKHIAVWGGHTETLLPTGGLWMMHCSEPGQVLGNLEIVFFTL